MNEEAQLEELLEQFGNSFGNINMESLESSVVLIGVVATAVISAIMYISKKQKEQKTQEELSAYYDDYMECDTDMNFEDYIFCRKHHIDVDKKIRKKRGLDKDEDADKNAENKEIAENGDETYEKDSGYGNG